MITEKNKDKVSEGFHSVVIALAIVSFLMNVSTSIYSCTSTKFVESCVTKDPIFLVSLRSIAEGVSYFIKILVGVFSDITKQRKKFLLIGYGSMLFIKPIFILVATGFLPLNLNTVFYSLAQMTDRLLNAVRDTPRDSMIADVTHINQRSQSFGLRRFFAALGSQMGSLLTVLFIQFYFKSINLKYTILYSIAALPAFYCFYILKLKVKEPEKTLEEEKENWFSIQGLLEDKKKLRNYIFLMILTFVISFGKFNEICIFQMANLSGHSESIIIAIYMYFYGVVALSSYFLSRRKKHKKNIVIMLYCILSLLINNILLGYFSQYTLSLFLCLTCLGVYIGVAESVISGAITTLFPKKNMRATLFGIMNTILGISALSSGCVITFLSRRISLAVIYRYGIIPPIISIILFIIFYHLYEDCHNNVK